MYDRLKAACQKDWDAYTQHDFVKGIARGDLPKECFQHYLKQDYLFLIHFARAYALSIYKADTIEDMRYGMEGVTAILDKELELHVAYSNEWGINPKEMENLEESKATMAYTRYVLERGMAGTIVDLHVALSPCVVGYAEIARWILEQDFTVLEGNPYRSWIDTYGGAEYQDHAGAAIERLSAAAARGSASDFDRYAKTFRDATRLEIGFWQMGLDLSE
ncbi:thiaminase II [Hwanghaeella grinnelliae]|uniref:Aminopyrimidine aminohydrolase n=1 Tax=Hwanghaeella grinnelliae TaxID=2500179 RepID=A0A437QKJ8_9PROT|nr:thiaminase II [Hwanghaeella grinnelliae]RVU35043.1 thiaminase II [Hwanghaeella grinnelliae]